jgi:DNA-binding XRE family transcriptional regulator
MVLRGFTQGALADEVGLTRQAFSRKLHNKAMFNQLEISAIARVLSLDCTEINDIFFLDSVANSHTM